MSKPRNLALALGFLVVTACGAGGEDRKLNVGDEDDDAKGGAGSFGSGPGGRTDGGIASGGEALSVHVEDIDDMTIEIVTLACAGDCADITAVARGGNPPYALKWEDGSKNPQRRVCLDASKKLTVRATDTAIDSDEFRYDAHTVSTEVTANVLDCSSPAADGGMPRASCGPGKIAPYKVVDKVPSTSTLTFVQTNGNLADYTYNNFGATGPLAIIGQTKRTIALGTCTKLYLASDAAGTKDVGWDDSVIIEYRDKPGEPVSKRWYYGTITVTYTPDNQVLMSSVAPTVAGSTLDPPVPNPLPFGYPPRAIDLMSLVPAGADGFELSIHVLDAGTVGSTTEIWVIPE